MDPTAVPGLPDGVGEFLRDDGVTALYPPQAAAVEAGVTDGESLVAAVPTASGKTLIAELAMLSAIDSGGTALYVVPLRALAGEKRETFERWERFGVDVGISTGNYDSDGEWLASRDVIVATSEKVDSLVRNDAPWIDDLACVVADEVHLVDDGERGPTLEVTLAKLRRINPDLQLVALSATVGNADVVADWLDAELVESEWRPIELKTGVHHGNAVNFDDGGQREVPVDTGERQTAALVGDALDERIDGTPGSSLVFVSSRSNAESAAERLRSVTERRLTDGERADLRALAEEIREVSDAETSDDLADCVAGGAAFHHAGLAGEHRSLVEDAFRDRLLKVVCATPTLAAGVNTPARRVIVRDWRRYDPEFGGMKPLDVLEVHQMMGRAGRPGLDPYGEAIVPASSVDESDELFERYVWGDPEPLESKLAVESALRTHVLATVASGFATTREGLLAFLGDTLYATQYGSGDGSDPELRRVTDRVLDYLAANGFLDRGDGALTPTSLGHTVSRLYLDPMTAAEIVDGLRAAAGADAGHDDPRPGASGGPAADETAPEASDVDGALDASSSDDGTPDASSSDDGALDASNSDDGTLDASDGDDEPSGVFRLGTELRDDDDESAESATPTDPVDISPLGLYHLVARTPDMYELYLKSGDRERYTEELYEREAELLGPTPSEFEDVRFEEWLAALKTGRLLEDWASEVAEDRITDRYGVGPGDVRGKVEAAEWLLGAAERLAGELDLGVGVAVRRARMRVEHGVREELLDLAGIRNVGRVRARRLYEAGVDSRAALREADKSVVLGALRGRRRTAETILENVGRPDPSMDGVTEAEGARPAAEDGGDDPSGGQSSLGDFE